VRATLGVFLLAIGCGGPSQRLNISYDDRFGGQTSFDLHGAQGAARPAVMLVHGGGWHEGSKEQLAGFAERLAQEGYVAATINYRLGAPGAYPAAVQDCRCALAYLQAHASELNLLSDRIAVLGHSAGGHLVSLMSVAADVEETKPDCPAGVEARPSAVIAAAAPEDLTALSWTAEAQNFLGGKLADVPERYAAASPLNHVRGGEPPFLLIHGTLDWFVPAEHSTRMRDALVAVGSEAEQLLLPGAGHVLSPAVSADHLAWEQYALDSPEAWIAVTDFLEHTVGR
jgi:acetyl esterase/lipase